MPRADPLETSIMRDCQRGALLCNNDEHRPTGSVCRKPAACRDEGRCYFVGRMERFLEANPGWDLAHIVAYVSPTEQDRLTPGLIRWHPGYDGFRWAL